MSKNTSEIPFTELVERSSAISRSGRNTVQKIRGMVQDVATREIPSKFDWNFLLVSSGFTTFNQYNTGSVSINTGDTAAIFASPATFDSTFVGRKITFAANDQVYEITAFNNTTSLTISPSFQGAQNVQVGAFVIFQSVYALANDFDRFPKMGGVYQWSGQKKKSMEEIPYRQYDNDATFVPIPNPEKIRMIGIDSAGNQLVELVPPPSTARNYGYDYFKQSKPMVETTAGTLLQVNANGTAVSGNTTARFLSAYANGSNNLWFRVDALGQGADSQWYRVLNIQNDSSLTLSTVFANSSISSSANYTICASPDMPSRLHIGVLYGAVRSLELDQNDDNFQFYHTQYYQVLSDSKRIYVSRPYSIDIEGIHTEYRYRY